MVMSVDWICLVCDCSGSGVGIGGGVGGSHGGSLTLTDTFLVYTVVVYILHL